MNKLSKCLKCLNFFSRTKKMEWSKDGYEEIENECLVTRKKLLNSEITTECTHFKEKPQHPPIC